jgi:hypothetical protein
VRRLAVTAAGLALAGMALAQPPARQSWTVALTPDRTLSVDVTVGDIRIHGEAPALLARIPVTVDDSGNDISVIARQTNQPSDPALRTDVTLRVPHESSLRAIRVMEGRIAVSSFAGKLDASVRRGSIDANGVQGTIRLETEIGDITASARLLPAGVLRLRTFNGNVRLTLVEQPRDARVLALALNGTIASDIPLTMKDTWGPRWGEATLGSGEPVISIDVVTGKIQISLK